MLRSNLDLHLEAGAGLYGSDDWSEYPVVAGLPFGTMFRALISGYNLTNVSVTGSNLAVPASGDPATDSIIDGVGWSWWCIGKHMPVWPVPYCQHFNPTNKTLKKGLLLPKLVELFNCSGVTVSGFTAQNSPFWTVVPTYSRNVLVRGMTILNPRNGGVRDILFEDVQVGSPDVVTSPWAIKFKVDTGALRNITFRRLRLGRIAGATVPPPTMEGLTFEDISVVAVKTNLTLKNITVENGSEPWGACRNVDLPSLVVEAVSPPLVCK
eukprot:gene11508-2323_t